MSNFSQLWNSHFVIRTSLCFLVEAFDHLRKQVKTVADRKVFAGKESHRVRAETAAELDALLPAILDRAFKGEL